jgi:sulfur-carrier protein
MIRVVLPYQLQTLAGVEREVRVCVQGAVTQRAILDALECAYPMLRGTIRDHATGQRRPKVRVFACNEDVSHDSPDAPLPDAVASGAEPLLILGAISGG